MPVRIRYNLFLQYDSLWRPSFLHFQYWFFCRSTGRNHWQYVKITMNMTSNQNRLFQTGVPLSVQESAHPWYGFQMLFTPNASANFTKSVFLSCVVLRKTIVIKQFLPLAYHAQHRVIHNQLHHRNLIFCQGGKFITVHMETAVSCNIDNLLSGFCYLGTIAAPRPKPMVPSPPDVIINCLG